MVDREGAIGLSLGPQRIDGNGIRKLDCGRRHGCVGRVSDGAFESAGAAERLSGFRQTEQNVQEHHEPKRLKVTMGALPNFSHG